MYTTYLLEVLNASIFFLRSVGLSLSPAVVAGRLSSTATSSSRIPST